ncbi:hypothetical protein ACEWBA_11065, partial [Vibrio parahaemolyticus]
NLIKIVVIYTSKFESHTANFLQKHNAFYTANSGLSLTLPPSFLTKEKQILALIFMKQIEK